MKCLLLENENSLLTMTAWSSQSWMPHGVTTPLLSNCNHLPFISPCNELDADLHQLIMWPRVKVSRQCQEIKLWTPTIRLPIAQAHIYAINPLTVLRRVLLNPECSGAEVVAFPCQVGVYEPGSTRSVSGAHKHNLAAVMWNYWACLVPTCVTRNCKKEKKFNSLATKECLYLITLTANLMVVNQWHVIQAEQPMDLLMNGV